jgi:hypothetical protein
MIKVAPCGLSDVSGPGCRLACADDADEQVSLEVYTRN